MNALAACINRVRRERCCVVQAVLNYCVCPVKPAADRSPGYADETGHTPFSLRTSGHTLASQSTRYFIFRPPHPPCPSYGPGLYVQPARPGDPAAPYGAGEQLLLFVVHLLQFTRPSLLLFKFSLCWRTGRAHVAQCNSTRPPPHCHVKITRQTRALVAVVMKVCHTLL